MKTNYIIFIIALSPSVVFFGCNSRTGVSSMEVLKAEIIKTEKEFNEAVKTRGLAEAFYYYADENAVIKRQNDTLIRGKENIRAYYQNPNYLNAELSWSPDFTDVSAGGSIGYTYGKYAWKTKDAEGNISEHKGVFHTVWKKQKDGTWKYVWD